MYVKVNKIVWRVVILRLKNYLTNLIPGRFR